MKVILGFDRKDVKHFRILFAVFFFFFVGVLILYGWNLCFVAAWGWVE